MPKTRQSAKSTQTSASALCDIELAELRSKGAAFRTCAEIAEKLIRQNYGKARIAPDCCGDGWSEEFELAYQAIEPHIPKMVVRYYRPPQGTAYCSFSFEAKNSVEALMFLLNPADMAFGEPGYLESTEYQAIKSEAQRVLDYVLNPPLELFLTETQIKLVIATDEKPRSIKEIAHKAGCEYQAARKYMPDLSRNGFVQRAEKAGYFRLD